MTDKDNTTDNWKCPFCGHEGAFIIKDAVLKNDWKELLCGCMQCNEMYIRKYKYIETIKLVRKIDKTYPVVDLDISVRSLNVLTQANIAFLDQMELFKYKDVLKWRNMGKKSLTEIKKVMEIKGLYFKHHD